MIRKGVSIVLCTFNGKTRLDRTFKHIVNQQFEGFPVEIIFVDNASTDGTLGYAISWWEKKGTKKISFRSFSQPIPGKSYAQDLGYKEASFEYLLVCDDDNWLVDNYLQIAFDLMESDEKIGALGGWCEGVFESEKPDWFDEYSNIYAVAKQGQQSGDITNKKGCLFGAGMVIRKSHWLQLKDLGFNHILSCRKGNKLSSGGDTEYSYALRMLGYKIWYDDRLYFKHFMTKGRMNLAYLSRLRKAMSYSNFVLWSYKDIMNNSIKSRRDFLFLARKGIPFQFIKHLINLRFGKFETREQAKLYFRNIKFTLLYFQEYKENIDKINSWFIKFK